MRSLLILSCISSLVFACGNSNKPTKDTTVDPATSTDAMPAETPEEKFARQQKDTVNKMCQRLIDCSIEDAKAKMTPEELKELDVPKITPVAVARCTDEYNQTALSPRQVVGIRECLGEATECSVFQDCIGAAGQGE